MDNPNVNQSSVSQGAFDLVSESPFQPIRHERKDGKWIIRYHINDAADMARFRQQNRFFSQRRERSLDMNSTQPFTTEQRQALAQIIRRIEGVCQVQFESVDDPARANMCFFTGNFDDDTLGRVRNYNTSTTQVIVANRIYVARERAGTGTSQQLTFNEGTTGYGTLLHEMLHGMGLQHPKRKITYADGTTYDNYWAYANGRNGTVMFPGGPGERSEDNDLGRYDIAALQYLYGQPSPAHGMQASVSGHPSGLSPDSRQRRNTEKAPQQ